MGHDQKINYMSIAASLCKLGFEHKHLDLLVSLYELVLRKEGLADMRDIADVQEACEDREFERQKPKLKKKFKRS